MGKKKLNKIEYDNVYPPLNGMDNVQNDPTKPKPSAIQEFLTHSQNLKSIIITARDRRYQEDEACLRIAKELYQRYGIIVKTKTNSLGSLQIDTEGQSKFTDKIMNFIVREAFTRQVSKSITCSEKILRKLGEKKNIEQFTADRFVTLRIDIPKERIHIEGGIESVMMAVDDVQEFITGNSNMITTVIDIPAVFHDFLKNSDNDKITQILKNGGKYSSISYKAPEFNKITINGCQKFVNDIKEAFLTYYEKLKSEMIQKSAVITPIQLKSFNSILPKNLFEIKKVSVVSYTNKEKSVVCIGGIPSSVEEIWKQLEDCLVKNTEASVNCPYWIAKSLIDLNDFQNVIYQNFNEIHISIHPKDEIIVFRAHAQKVPEIKNVIWKILEDLKKSWAYEMMEVSDEVFKIHDAKDIERIRSIEEEFKVKIYIDTGLKGISLLKPNHELEPPKYLILVVGTPSQVIGAKKRLDELNAFYQSFESKTISISNHLHRYIIGSKGKTLNDIIVNNGKNCTVSLGKHSYNLDECIIRGPKNEIENLETAIIKKAAEFEELHFKMSITVLKKVIPTVIAEKNKLLQALRKTAPYEAITFPSNTSTDIEIIGKKEHVLKCKTCIDNFISEIMKSITKSIPVPQKLVQVFTDCRDAILKAVSDDAGGAVTVKLPDNLKSEQITIFGPEKAVDTTISIFNKLAAGNSEELSYDMIKVNTAYVQSLQSLIFKIIENSGVRVYFPSLNKKLEEDKILVFGKASGVSNVKKAIEEAIIGIKNTVEEVINIKADYKKEFLKKRGDEETLVQKLSAENGGVRIFLGDRVGDASTISVTIKGHISHVENVIKTINKLTSEFDRRSEIKISFYTKTLHSILSKCRNLLKNTMVNYNVVLSISESYYDAIKSQKFDSNCEITVRGLPEDISKANAYISSWSIITHRYPCPHYVQRNIFSFKSDHYSHITKNLMVDLELGFKSDPPFDDVVISGLKDNVDAAIQYLDKEVEEDYEHRFYVPEKYFKRLIGKNGSNVQKFNQDNGVTLSIPSRSIEEDAIVIYGRKTDCFKAAAKITEMIEKWDSMITEDFQIDSRFKFAICGPKNENIRKMAKNYGVLVNVVMSKTKTDKYRTIQISGVPEDIEKLVSELKKMISVLNEDIEDDYRYEPRNEQPYEIDISSISIANHTSQKSKKESRKQQISNRTCIPAAISDMDNLASSISNMDNQIQTVADHK